MNTHEILREVVTTLSGLPGDFPGHADLYLELGVPSVVAIQLLIELEERFGMQVPDDEFVSSTTLDALVDLVDRLRAQPHDAFAC